MPVCFPHVPFCGHTQASETDSWSPHVSDTLTVQQNRLAFMAVAHKDMGSRFFAAQFFQWAIQIAQGTSNRLWDGYFSPAGTALSVKARLSMILQSVPLLHLERKELSNHSLAATVFPPFARTWKSFDLKMFQQCEIQLETVVPKSLFWFCTAKTT